jgi:hypothetical protein
MLYTGGVAGASREEEPRDEGGPLPSDGDVKGRRMKVNQRQGLAGGTKLPAFSSWLLAGRLEEEGGGLVISPEEVHSIKTVGELAQHIEKIRQDDGTE